MCKECEENFQTLSKIQKTNGVKMSVHPTLIFWTFGVGKAFLIMTPNSEVITEKTGKFEYAFQKLQIKKQAENPMTNSKTQRPCYKACNLWYRHRLITLVNKWRNSTNQ